tara:strand:+ start:2594 stop:3445 length:852 start_codon:yes stop_codon:yes gene_type:complete
LKKSLGKGLDSLIRSNNESENSKVGNLNEVFISDIIPNDKQPRKNFDEESLTDLSESIKQHGIIQPLTIKDNNDGKYLIVAGERRWRAAQIAGLSKVPVRVIQADEKKFSELALVENLQREDLNPIEIAKAIKELIDIYKLTNEEISQIIGKKRSSILNTLRILELPNEIQDLIIQGKLSRGHAIALLSIGFEKEMLKVSRIILEKNLSVRDVEKISKKYKVNNNEEVKKEDDSNQIYILNLGKELENRLGLSTKIKGNSNSGKVEIKYTNLEELNNLLRFFK